MIKVEADSIEEAYAQAAHELECSVTELDIEVIQNPSRGVVGFFKKSAIIVAGCKMPSEKNSYKNRTKSIEVNSSTGFKKEQEESAVSKVVSNKILSKIDETLNSIAKPIILTKKVISKDRDAKKSEAKKRRENLIDNSQGNSSAIENFFEETPSLKTIRLEIEERINHLFKFACFDIEPVRVSFYDDQTLLIVFNGADAALLIGKEGYRYKALSYMLFNWINGKYNLQLRLEIAQFLKNQENMIRNYLLDVYEAVDKNGRAQTKVLDGVLVQIALRELRAHYSDKYVAIRSNNEGERYIIINSFQNRL